jgi:ribosomal protein L14
MVFLEKKGSILEKEIVRRKDQFWRKKGSILEKDI